jgi:hypothetical protein
MVKITFANYDILLYHGARIIYGDSVGYVERDGGWAGGFKVAGRSIRNLLEEYEVKLLGD